MHLWLALALVAVVFVLSACVGSAAFCSEGPEAAGKQCYRGQLELQSR